MAPAQPEVKIEMSTGQLRLGSRQLVLLPPQVLADIHKELEERLGPRAGEYFYAAGQGWAVREARRLKSALMEEGPALAKLFCEQMGELGWGSWQLQDCDPAARRLRVQLRHSPLAPYYGQSDEPVCHLLAGMVAGLAEVVLGGAAACRELVCLAQQQPWCQFEALAQQVDEADSWDW